MNQQVPDFVPVFTGLVGCFMLLIYLGVIVVTVWSFCKICSKTGYSWALGLLMLVPIANLVLILVLGFSTWPIHREMQALRQQNSVQSV
ncbi:MAG: hypothetical protein ACYSRQ_01905 [Planctomycetota bacterium]|jgi:UPF0716 family protein affecting phage T7 exclusion